MKARATFTWKRSRGAGDQVRIDGILSQIKFIQTQAGEQAISA